MDVSLDCSALLSRQLALLSALISSLRADPPGHDTARLLRELSNQAVLHVLSRERLLVPAFRQLGRKRLPLEILAAHEQLKQALANLMLAAQRGEPFADALEAFSNCDRQKWLDHDQLIPELRAAMDIHQRRQLCNDIELMFETGRCPELEGPASAGSPRELIQEAEVVLSSLAAASRRNAVLVPRDAAVAQAAFAGRARSGAAKAQRAVRREN